MQKKYVQLLLALMLLSVRMMNAQDCFDQCTTSCDDTYDWQIQFRALIQKPSANHLHYAAQATPLPIQSPHWNIYDIHPGYHFGFDLGARKFLDTCNTYLAANWIHFKSHSCTQHQVPVIDSDMIGPFFEIGPDARPYKTAAGSVRYSFNVAHFVFGKTVCFGDCLETDFFAGVNFADIKQCISATYKGADTEGSNAAIFRNISTPSSYIGAGPEFGCSFAYELCGDLYFVGRVSGSLLMGTAKNFTLYSSESPALVAEFTSPNNQTTCVENRAQVVPAFEERLGLSAHLPKWACFDACIEVGYEARVYINALQSVDMGSEVVTLPFPVIDAIGVFARTFQRTLSNFALAGPYIGIDVTF